MFVFKVAYVYLLLSKTMIHEASPAVTVLDKGIFPVEKGSVAMQFYVDVENTDDSSTCKINSRPKMCCLEDEPYRDCYTDTIYGDNIESLMPKRRETLIYVYPTLYQHDQVGYCDFEIKFKCGLQKRSTNVAVSIPFNTRMSTKKPLEYLKRFSEKDKRACNSLDEDALNNCAPVNCDFKYSGRRPFFDTTRNKCISAPSCVTKIGKEFPDVVYVPKTNICRNLDRSISLGDIYSINTGLGVVTESAQAAKKTYKVQVKSNCTTISQNLCLLKDLMTGTLCPLFNVDTTNYGDCCKTAMLSIFACVVCISILLLSIICCIHTTVCMYRKWARGEMSGMFDGFKSKMKKKRDVNNKASHLSGDLTYNLLKEVIIRDLPLELRDSLVEICDRISNEVKQKRRYRMVDLGSQVNLLEGDSGSPTSSGRSRNYDEE